MLDICILIIRMHARFQQANASSCLVTQLTNKKEASLLLHLVLIL